MSAIDSGRGARSPRELLSVFAERVNTRELEALVWFCDMAWFPRLVSGASLGFLDWYEGWLDAQLFHARRRTRGADA